MKYHHFLFVILLLFGLHLDCLLHAQTITTVAGNNVPGYSGDGGMATLAQLFQPSSIAVDDSGNIYIVDNSNDNIRKVSASGIITTIAGDRHRLGSPRIQDVVPCYTRDGGPAAEAIVWKPQGIAADHSGNVYFIEVCGGIRKISADGIITTIANNRRLSSANIDSDLAANAMRYEPRKLAIDKNDNIYYADSKADIVRKITTQGTITAIAGTGIQGYSGDGLSATTARLNGPWGVAVDDSGNVFINDRGNGRIRKVNAAGIITTIAGNGEEGYSGDGGSAPDATFNDPRGVAADHYGNIYIADSRNNAVRRIDAEGIITTFAGNGKSLRNGDGGPASSAKLYWPSDVAADNSGNVYIADENHYAVRKVTVPLRTANKPPLPQADTTDNFTVSADAERGEVTITTIPGGYSSYAISDMQNKELITGTITGSHTKVDISSLSAGSYYITLKKENKQKTLQFMLDR